MRVTAQVQLPESGAVYLVDQVFDTHLLQALHNLAQHTTGWSELQRFAHRPGRQVYTGDSPVISQLTQAATDPELVQQLSRTSGLTLAYWGLDLWRDSSGYRIDPHQDPMDTPRFCHLQIYLSDPHTWNLGTAFYSSASATTGLFQIPYRLNSGYFMVTGAEVWHGLPEIASAHTRISVQLRYQVL